MKVTFCLSITLILSVFCFPANSQDSAYYFFQEEYEKRIEQTHLEGVYIPKDLDECYTALQKLSSKESISKFKNTPEDTIAYKIHFSLGKWMIKNWGFYEGSRLSHQLKQMGIHHPDDMANFITVTFHRLLNGKELQIEKLIERYQKFRKEEQDSLLNRGTVIDQWSIPKKE